MRLSLDLGLGSVATLNAGGYSAEAAALFARFTTPPDSARKTLINDLIVSLKTAGVWTKLDALYVMAAADNQAARRNWIADVGNLTAVSAPTFLADRGYTGDGVSSYLTGIDYASLTKYGLNAGCVGAHIGTSVTASGQNDTSFATNATGRMNLNAASTGPAAFGAIQSVTGDSFSVASSIGLLAMQRIDAATVQFSKAGSAFNTVARASTGAPSGVLQSGRGSGATAYSTRRQQALFVGGALSDAEIAATNTAINTYMQAVGAA